MELLRLTSALRQYPAIKKKLADLKAGNKIVFSAMIGAATSALIATCVDDHDSCLIITTNTDRADLLKNELSLFSAKTATIFPSPDSLPGPAYQPSKEIIGQRQTVLEAWCRGKPRIVIAPIEALLWKTTLRVESIRVSEDQNIGRDKLIGRLVDLGYRRFDISGERGEFSVRGGIIDIFPVNGEAPVRLELLGDKVESLRTFDPYSQRSVTKINEVVILPVEEKPETSIIKLLPPKTVVVMVDSLAVANSAAKIERESNTFIDYREIVRAVQVELSPFLQPGDDELFSLPDEYRDRLEAVPRRVKPLVREGVAEELLSDLKMGDYVVHENYGVGIYRGNELLAVEGSQLEYLQIEFAGGDKVYVPPPMIGLVEKYSGGRESRPRLSRLGSGEWQKSCRAVKSSLRDMTQELLQLYAARQKLAGFAFPADDLWQKELEATFPYEETPDQLAAINAVKKDMESGEAMDRLVCGDVGYGKTEVAIRAAAKAAAAGKQVALLAPTTILVEQHYNNFLQRFQNFPYIIEMLSRFRSAAEQAKTVKQLAEGGVDIILGTHRLLSKDIAFRDLGLLIIDEEQKFGVGHKEKLKKLRQNVDVLTLTATPIPRTLYFSLSGIRELSMIRTAPVDRSPIRTYVAPYSETVIRETIRRELDRGGQVYFVHNHVETIMGVAAKIKRLVPEARVAVGHGQMAEKSLEKTMLKFLDRQSDVLVCTAIIESGLDIPNVNTILIDQADRFGLSQLYQIRGRVGRSAVRAYAYLFYQPAKSLSDQAVERLKALQEFTALGSGYKLAMRDLEIRGAGNLLGAEQSGHVYEVGFDLYCELLEEAVREIKGETVLVPRTVEIDLKVNAGLPLNYITDERQRIALYRRMNLITEDQAVSELKAELIDRFGPLPDQVKSLIRLLELKIVALQAGVKKISEDKESIRVEWPGRKVKLIKIGQQDKIGLVKKVLVNVKPNTAG